MNKFTTKREKRLKKIEDKLFPTRYSMWSLYHKDGDKLKEIDEGLEYLDDRLSKIEGKMNTLFDHLKLEYVEITEKNGGTKKYTKLRKKTKKAK